jgi:hypothetical protein
MQELCTKSLRVYMRKRVKPKCSPRVHASTPRSHVFYSTFPRYYSTFPRFHVLAFHVSTFPRSMFPCASALRAFHFFSHVTLLMANLINLNTAFLRYNFHIFLFYYTCSQITPPTTYPYLGSVGTLNLNDTNLSQITIAPDARSQEYRHTPCSLVSVRRLIANLRTMAHSLSYHRKF